MNEINFWNGLTDEEKKIAMEAVADFQETKLRKEKIDALKEEIFNDIGTLYNLMGAVEWNDFTEDLINEFPIT